MRTSFDEILRRLVLLGLPLASIDCNTTPLRRLADGSSDVFLLNDGNATADAARDVFGADGPSGGMSGAGGFGGMSGAGGGGGTGGCAMNCRCGTIDTVFTVPRPTYPTDAWDRCDTSGDCADLCNQQAHAAYGVSMVFFTFTTCEVVDARDAAGTDLDATAPDADSSGSILDVHAVYSYLDCTGRRPAGLVRRRRASSGSMTGRWLADVAALEAASVPAFLRLATELEAHRAPRRLVGAARRAARDEVRHYALTARAARSHGAVATPPRVRRMPVRSLSAVATENAREGCVRETFGAMTAAYQARHAGDPRLRAMMGAIAHDEARHARLAWEIDAWASSVLSPQAVRFAQAARRTAGEALAAEVMVAAPPAGALAGPLGLPSGPVARALVSQARRLLWADTSRAL